MTQHPPLPLGVPPAAPAVDITGAAEELGFQVSPSPATLPVFRDAVPPGAGHGSPGLPAPFLPVGRSDLPTLRHQAARAQASPLLTQLLEAMPGAACLINAHRQIIAANRQLLFTIGVPALAQALGQRPGEALACVRAHAPPDGCGTTAWCATCGVAQALKTATTERRTVTGECRVTVARDGRTSLDLEATVTPLEFEGELLTVLSLHDLSGEKRRDVLERVFFHDVLNTAGGIHGLARLTADPETAPDFPEAPVTLARLAAQLVEEIELQRALRAAERGEYQPSLVLTDVRGLLEDVAMLYRAHDVARRRTLDVAAGEPVAWVTDPVILRRVLGNLVKNALEASPRGGTVTLSAARTEAALELRVHNPGVMPAEVQAQVFQRSFSTKGGVGRGIGSYSVQLFAERVLGGQVSFTSSAAEGTTFVVHFPDV